MAKDIILKTGTYYQVVNNKDIASGKIPGASLEKFFVNLLKNPTCCAKYVTLTKGNVTQITSIGTAVTLNQPAGEITTVSISSLPADSSGTFTVNNNYVKTDSIILATVNDWTGTLGFPVVLVDDVVAGSFKITVRNAAPVTADGTINIAFAVM